MLIDIIDFISVGSNFYNKLLTLNAPEVNRIQINFGMYFKILITPTWTITGSIKTA